MIVVTALTLAGCGSPRTTIVRNVSLDQAVVCYVGGDLQRAEALLNEIVGKDCVDEDCVTAYLYLGRIYLAWGEYEKAADAFSAGQALGGDVRFAEYFEEARGHLTTSPTRIARMPRVKRGELAALIGEMFGSRLLPPAGGADESWGAGEPGEGVPLARREDAGATGGIERGIAIVSQAGVMNVLPDGDFHPGEDVTRPAFYAVTWRLGNALGARGDVLAGLFPGGFRGTLAQRGEEGRRPTGDDEFVSGSEARRILDALARAVGAEDE